MLDRAVKHLGVSVIFNVLVEANTFPCIVEDIVPADRGDADYASSVIEHILHITFGGRFEVRFIASLFVLLFEVLDWDVLGCDLRLCYSSFSFICQLVGKGIPIKGIDGRLSCCWVDGRCYQWAEWVCGGFYRFLKVD